MAPSAEPEKTPRLKSVVSAPMRSILSGSFLISFSPVYVRLADIGPGAAGFYRNLGGGFFLFITAIFRLRSRAFSASRSAYLMTLLCGAVFALDLSFWHRSVQMAGPGLATILGNFQVFLMGAWGFLVLREKFTLRYLFAVAVAFAGLWLLTHPQEGADGTSGVFFEGVVYGLLTAPVYTAYMLLLRRSSRLQRPLPEMMNIALLSLTAAAILGTLAWFGGEKIALDSMRSLASMIAYAFFSQFLGWLLIYRGLARGAPVSLAGMGVLVQPTFAFIWDILFFDGLAGPDQILGGLACLGGIGLAIWPQRRAGKAT